jgi:phosphatidylserine/phosphatidylglycerophosphate/cardiolipin synthase-like enzyme
MSFCCGKEESMAQFLITSKINFLLEELISSAKEQLILISPYLKLNDRMRELLQDKNGQLVEVNIVYGKQELHDSERQWLAGQKHINVSFCKNLHAKCYLSEHYCIVTSMNLHDFSQVNNNEMGIGIHKTQDKMLYGAVFDEAQRLIRISDAVNVAAQSEKDAGNFEKMQEYAKLTTAKLAVHYDKSTNEMFGMLVKSGYLDMIKGEYELTEKGKKVGGEKKTGRYGPYFLWNKPQSKK